MPITSEKVLRMMNEIQGKGGPAIGHWHQLRRWLKEDEQVQESFQDAIRNDPDMTTEQKVYWLSQEAPQYQPPVSTLAELEKKPRDKRSPLEQSILDAANLEDMRDGDTTLMELAITELNHLRAKEPEEISADLTKGSTTVHRIERKRILVGEMSNAICNLANIIEDWNEAQAEPDERGPGNGAIGLVVFDDGSGYIAEFQQSPDGNPLGDGTVIHEFSTPEDAQDWFIDNLSGRSLLGEPSV